MKESDYYSEISDLEKDLQLSGKKGSDLADFQSRLGGLMYRFAEDESLGVDRYGLYLIQALISYYQGDCGKSKRYLDYSLAINGSTNKTIDELYERLMKQDFKRKKERIWWVLIIFPFVSLIFVALMQILVHFVFNSSDNVSTNPPIVVAFNIVSVIIGVIAILLLLLIPIWIIELSAAKKHNANHGFGAALSKTKGVWIAIIFGWWYWAIYTYKIDKRKTWWNLAGIIVTIGLWGWIVWIWTIVNAVKRPKKFYELYPYYS